MKSIKNRILAVMMALAMLITYKPMLSYALTEEAEDIGEAAAEAVEDIVEPETEPEEIDEHTEDSAKIDSLLFGLEPAENETFVSERKAFKIKAALAGNKKTNAIKAEDIRKFGKDRYDTAIEVAEMYKSVSGSEFENVVVAYGENFPDALSGVYLAKVKNAPILLVKPSVEDDIVDYISKNIASGGKVYILGGTGVVSTAFENKIRAKGIEPKRLGGRDRYETNLEILKEAGVSNEDILVCTGANYPDSLSAAASGKPILLVGSALTNVQKSYIPSPSKGTVYIIGGVGVVSEKIETGLRALGYDPKRLWGPTRYETSTAVAEEFFPETKTVMLAYALNFPDGLSGGPLALLEDAPIVLTDSNNPGEARNYVERSGAFRSITLGGDTLISDKAIWFIMGRKSPYINVDKYTKIQVGDIAEIQTDSNYGTTYEVKDNSNVITVGEKTTTYNEKGLPVERYPVKGEKAGTAVLIFTDDFEGSRLVTNSITVIVVNGEASVKTLYDIIETTGYINRNGEITVKHTIDGKSVYFVNHSDTVEMVCVARDDDTNAYTSMKAPLESHDIYSTTIIKETTGATVEYKSDIAPGQYTDSTVLTIKNIQNPSEEDINFVTSTFRTSMSTWNSAVQENYGMIMNELGFTNY